MKPLHLRCFAIMAIVCSLCGVVPAGAQACSDHNIDPTKVSAELLANPTESGIQRAAAIIGTPMIPALRQLASKGDPNYSEIAIAARIALAKLADGPTLHELEESLSAKGYRDAVIRILREAGTPQTLAILMNFVLTDNCRTCEFLDDYYIDERIWAGRSIAWMIPDPPIGDGGNLDIALPIWKEWWAKNKDHPLPPPPHEALSDPYLRCLARLAEFNEYNAIWQLADAGRQQVIPTLKEFRHQDPDAVRAALAKLGDRNEFEAIVRELKSDHYGYALRKLQYIATREAVDVITTELGKPPKADYRRSVADHRNSCLGTLIQMVQDPPLPKSADYTNRDIELWKNWWSQHRDSAELIPYRP